MKSLAALASPLLLLTSFCGGLELTRAQREPPPRQKPGPVVPVHPESLSGREEDCIYRQLSGGTRPERIVGKEVEYPPDHRPWGGKPGVLIIESVIAPDGRIARFQVLRGPHDEILDRALAEALKEWRFTPAKLHGKPVAVYYMLTIEVNRSADRYGRSVGGRSPGPGNSGHAPPSSSMVSSSSSEPYR